MYLRKSIHEIFNIVYFICSSLGLLVVSSLSSLTKTKSSVWIDSNVSVVNILNSVKDHIVKDKPHSHLSPSFSFLEAAIITSVGSVYLSRYLCLKTSVCVRHTYLYYRYITYIFMQICALWNCLSIDVNICPPLRFSFPFYFVFNKW